MVIHRFRRSSTLLISASALLMAAGCSTVTRGVGTEGAGSSAATLSTVTLSGYVTWQASMPDGPVQTLSGSPWPITLPEPYDPTAAVDICRRQLPLMQPRFSQIVILDSANRTLGAGEINTDDVESGQTTAEANPAFDDGGDFQCAVAWTGPLVPPQSAYVVTFNGNRHVVNGADAPTQVNLSVS